MRVESKGAGQRHTGLYTHICTCMNVHKSMHIHTWDSRWVHARGDWGYDRRMAALRAYAQLGSVVQGRRPALF